MIMSGIDPNINLPVAAECSVNFLIFEALLDVLNSCSRKSHQKY